MSKFNCAGMTIVTPVILLISIACGSISSGSSDDVNNKNIFQQYNVWYDKEKEEVRTFAQFRFGGSDGTTLILDSDSKVTANSNAMIETNKLQLNPALGGTYYVRTFKLGDLAGRRINFRYNNNLNESFQNTIVIPETLPSVKPISSEQIKKIRAEGLTLNIENLEPTQNLRDVLCRLSSRVDGSQKQTYMDLKTQKCFFDTEQFASLDSDIYRIELKATWLVESFGGRTYITTVNRPAEIEIPADSRILWND